MPSKMRIRANRGLVLLAVSSVTLALAGCGTQPEPKVSLKRSKEYFSESEYGVKASPRISHLKSNLPRGGGRYQVGKPYKVKGRWYKPEEDPDYKKVGGASWYGDAFHGRLTANGEVYDMTHLTAAHPTMPLPSYARVTNLENGSSVIVRVNDRGPFANGRIIDLSKRAAQMLDYQHSGVAKVQVEYVGPAPLHGQDESYLLASYQPGGRAPDPSDGLPTGVMIAMNGPTPTTAASAAAFSSQPGLQPASVKSDIQLPAVGPIIPDRPEIGLVLNRSGRLAPALSYASERVRNAAEAFDTILQPAMTSEDVKRFWKQRNNVAASEMAMPETGYIVAGAWHSRSEADRRMQALSSYGRVALEESRQDGDTWYSLNLYPDGRMDLDRMLQAAWASGASDALVVRN